MEFVIEDDIPVPERGQLSEISTVLRELKVGQSVLITAPPRTIRNTVANVHKKTGLNFTSRLIDQDKMRVWRIE